MYNATHFQLTAIGAFGEHGQSAVKLVVSPKKPVLEFAIIPLKHMEEKLAMVLTRTKILVKIMIAPVRPLTPGY